MERKTQISIAIGICATVAAIYFWLPKENDRLSRTLAPAGVAVREPQRQAQTLPAPRPTFPRQVEAAVPVEDTPQPDAAATATQLALEQGLAEIVTAVHKVEIANKHTIYAQRSPSLEIVGMEIRQPSDEQMEEIHHTLTRAVNAVDAISPGSQAVDEMRERGGDLIKTHCVYPHPVKAIGYTERNGKSEFWEWYGPDIQMVMPDKKGYPIPTTNETSLRFDFKFGEADSWAAKRYSHLFSFEQ